MRFAIAFFVKLIFRSVLRVLHDIVRKHGSHGPDNRASGIAELLFLLRDVDDGDATVGTVFPDDVWRLISAALLRDLVGIPAIRVEAERLGIMPDE